MFLNRLSQCCVLALKSNDGDYDNDSDNDANDDYDANDNDDCGNDNNDDDCGNDNGDHNNDENSADDNNNTPDARHAHEDDRPIFSTSSHRMLKVRKNDVNNVMFCC